MLNAVPMLKNIYRLEQQKTVVKLPIEFLPQNLESNPTKFLFQKFGDKGDQFFIKIPHLGDVNEPESALTLFPKVEGYHD